jgi:hypothetical protein
MANFLRFSVIVVVVCTIFQIPYSVGGGRIGQILLRAALNVGVLCVVPIVYKILPLAGDKPVSGKRWAIAAVLLFVVLAIEDFVRFSYFDRFPLLNRLAGIAHWEGVWISIVLIGFMAVVIILRQAKFTNGERRR